MRLQQKETLHIQYDLLSKLNPSDHKINSSIAMYLPKLTSAYSKHKKSCFKEYVSGSRIIKELPLLIFNSINRESTQHTRLQRCNTEQKKPKGFDAVSPFFKSYIRKSLQRRKMEVNLQKQRQSQCKKSLIQVVSLECLSINNPSSTKTSFKPLSTKKADTTFSRYETSESNHPNLDLVAAQMQKKPEQLLLEKRQLRFTKRETIRFQKVILKMRSQRPKGIIPREEDLSPWNMNAREDLQ